MVSRASKGWIGVCQTRVFVEIMCRDIGNGAYWAMGIVEEAVLQG